MHMRRTATEDTEIRAQKIRRGEKVVLWYCSANRDEEVFERPSTFDVDRRGAMRRLADGLRHRRALLPRRHLAELQLRIVSEELLGRSPEIWPVGEVRRLRSNSISGIKEMRVVRGGG